VLLVVCFAWLVGLGISVLAGRRGEKKGWVGLDLREVSVDIAYRRGFGREVLGWLSEW
jgi:hypothetical protein